MTRVQGAFVSEDDLHRVVGFLKEQGRPVCDESILKAREGSADRGGVDDEDDPVYDEAVELVARMEEVSVSKLQREMRLGHNKAAKIIERMEREGLVGPANGVKPRQVLMRAGTPGEANPVPNLWGIHRTSPPDGPHQGRPTRPRARSARTWYSRPMPARNRQWLLARRPRGQVEPDDFRLVAREVPSPRDGEVLVRVQYLSLDPYMRGRMDEGRSYAPSQALDEVMIGGTVGEVIESRHPRFAPGDLVVGAGGWQEFFVSDGQGLRKASRALPASVYLGAAGMPGVTAWYGLLRIGKPRAGETVVVSAASGAVGSVVGQLARLRGCRAVGIAGGPAKCAHVVDDLGFDACVDHKADGFGAALAAAVPDGVDVLFENVGGAILDASLARMNAFGRIAICGLISGYDRQDYSVRNVRSILVNRLTVQGFIVSDHLDQWPEALGELTAAIADGKLRYRETIADGIESAPRAFIGLLRGENLGKQVVRVAG